MMGALKNLWRERLTNYFKEIGKYGKLIFNDHLSIILFVLFGFGAIAYKNLLSRVSILSSNHVAFPVIIISIFILLLIFMMGEPLWLTKKADISYLFPRGHDFDQYWLMGTIIADILPLISLVIIGVLIYPFIVSVTYWTMRFIWLFLLWLVFARITSSLIHYLAIYQSPWIALLRSSLIHGLCFVFLILTLLLLPFSMSNLFAGLIFLFLFGWIYWQMQKRKDYPIDFNYVVEKELKRQANFYRIIALFVEVPVIKPEIKRQQFLDCLFLKLPHLNRNRYGFLFIRQLFRNNLYRSVWVKVTLVMAILILVMDIPWLMAFAGVMGILMTVIQLLPLLDSYDTNPYQQIYPNRQDDKLKAFQQSVLIILIVQWIVFLISAALSSGLGRSFVFIFFIWGAVILVMLYLYVPWRNRRILNKKKP